MPAVDQGRLNLPPVRRARIQYGDETHAELMEEARSVFRIELIRELHGGAVEPPVAEERLVARYNHVLGQAQLIVDPCASLGGKGRQGRAMEQHLSRDALYQVFDGWLINLIGHNSARIQT